MRAPLFLVLGLLIGGVGAILFQRSQPPPPGTEAETIAELERTVRRDQLRIAALEQTEANAAARIQRFAAAGRRSIVQDIKAGRPVDLNQIFNTAKPFLLELAPLTERLQRRDQKRLIENVVADMSKSYGLNASQQAGLKAFLEQQATDHADRLRDVVSRPDSTLEEYVRAAREFQPFENVDAFMESTLQGDVLAGYRSERLAERVNRIQHEADRRVDHLNNIVALDDSQQDQVFALMARGSKHFDPAMQFDGLGDDRAVIAPGQSRDEAIFAVLSPEQRQQYEAHRAEQRRKAEEDMAEVGLKLPDDWDLFEW